MRVRASRESIARFNKRDKKGDGDQSNFGSEPHSLMGMRRAMKSDLLLFLGGVADVVCMPEYCSDRCKLALDLQRSLFLVQNGYPLSCKSSSGGVMLGGLALRLYWVRRSLRLRPAAYDG